MHITIDLTPEEEERLHAIAAREGQDTVTTARGLFRHALQQERPEDKVQTAAEPESAYEALKDFIGKFDSRQVREEDKVPRSSDPHERAYGEIIEEKYRKQGFKI